MQAKKKFGQNFLKDTSVLNKIIQSMSHNNNKLVEIGPGLGDLTSKLLEHKKVKAYEVDDDLSAYLKTHFCKQIQDGNLELIEQDVMLSWEQGSLEVGNYDIVANLPYYIATAIILRALRDTKCKNITVMIQKEVALKFAAKEGQKEFCSLSVLASSIAKVELLFDVLPSSFEPEPKVVSSLIRFEKFQEYEDIFSQDEFMRFEKFLKVAFSQPRKTLIKNLSQAYAKDTLIDSFERFKLPLHVRGHQVDTSTFLCLYENITKVQKYERTNSKQEKASR